MTCISCSHGALRDTADAERDKILRRMAAQGLVNCTLSPYRATFHALRFICRRFSRADEEIVAARERWANGLQR